MALKSPSSMLPAFIIPFVAAFASSLSYTSSLDYYTDFTKRFLRPTMSSPASMKRSMDRAIDALLSASKRIDGTYIEMDSSSSDSGSSSSSDSHILSTLEAANDGLSWELKITNFISNKSGVMHFPKSIGRLIPDSKNTIALHDNSASVIYECTIHTAQRSREEKYLAGRSWLAFVKEKKLQVGDTLKLNIGGSPLAIYVDIARKSG